MASGAPPVEGLPSAVKMYLHGLEARISALESPQGYQGAFLTASANLTAASAAEFSNTFAFASDLHTAVYSDGTHWRRCDTGAVIV